MGSELLTYSCLTWRVFCDTFFIKMPRGVKSKDWEVGKGYNR